MGQDVERNVKGEWYAKDIKQLTAGEVPKAEIWTFGFPCTDISISGRMAGLHGARSGLFFTVTGLLKSTASEISPDMLSLRMLNIFCLAREAEILPPFSLSYGKQGTTANGVLSIPKTLTCPRIGRECTLLDILEEEVDEKYFLSAEQTRRLLKDL